MDRPRRRTKRMRPEMLSEKLCRADYTVKEFVTMSSAKITETVSVATTDDDDQKQSKRKGIGQEVATWKINHYDETGKVSRRHRLKIEQDELYSRYTNFGKSYLYDYEDDEVLGIKMDFKSFAGYIDPATNALLSDINLRKMYRSQGDHIDEFDEEETVNQEWNQMENDRGGSPLRTNTPLFSTNVPEMNMDAPLELDAPVPEPESDVSLTDQLNESDTGTPLETSASSSEASAGTGMSTSCDKIPVQCMTTMATITATKAIPEQVALTLNILKLPEKMLRRKCLFQLPKELKPAKVIKKSLDAGLVPINETEIIDVCRNARESTLSSCALFLNLTDDALKAIPTPPPSPIPGDEIEFLGFEEDAEFLNKSDILSSTLLNPVMGANHADPKMKCRTMSNDSGFQSPTASVRFSCDDGGPSDFDSGIGTSCIFDDNSVKMSQCASDTDNDESLSKKEAVIDVIQEATPIAEIGLPDVAEKRLLERIEQTQNVTEQVIQWQSYLKPILKESASRGNFDIHELGNDIMNEFETDSGEHRPVITFQDIIRNKPQPDICRYFLSTLLLANTENVRIQVTDLPHKVPRQQNVAEFKAIQLTFLKSEQHYKDMEEMYDDDGKINAKVKRRAQQSAIEDSVEQLPKKKKIKEK